MPNRPGRTAARTARPPMTATEMAAPPAQRIDPDAHAAFMLVSIANRLSASASRAYMRQFGVGVMEWRVVGMLAGRPGITANQIGQVSGVDKSSISRAVHALIRRGYLDSREDAADSRRTRLFLTPEGHALHDRIIVSSLAREERLLHGFSEAERRTLFGMLGRISANMPLVNAHDPAGDDAAAPP